MAGWQGADWPRVRFTGKRDGYVLDPFLMIAGLLYDVI
jgi:hypothetical protein